MWHASKKYKTMKEYDYFTLILHSPLYYFKVNEEPFTYKSKESELVMAFMLSTPESFETDKENFLSSPLWIGKTSPENTYNQSKNSTALNIPQGQYFFSQIRKNLNKEECIDFAIEVHKEGLWQRKGLGEFMYIRYLYEDGSPVTQVLREIKTAQ